MAPVATLALGPTCRLRGDIFHRDSDDGQGPSDPAKPVPNARVARSGSKTAEAVSDANERVALRSVRAVGIAQGFTVRGNEQAGKVALLAASTMLSRGALLELVVSRTRAAVDRIGAALTARADEGAIRTRWAPERRRQPSNVAPRVEERPWTRAGATCRWYPEREGREREGGS